MTKLQNFLESVSEIETQKISLDGTFVVAGNRAYLACSFERRYDLVMSVGLNYGELKDILISKVPAFGGGPHMYCDEATVAGTLVASRRNGVACYEFQEVSSLTIARRGRQYDVLP